MLIRLIRDNQTRIFVVNENDSQETKDMILHQWCDCIRAGWKFDSVTFNK
jgi:hypothetical protein